LLMQAEADCKTSR